MAPELTAPLKSANGSRASRRGKTKTFPKKERQGRACSASRWSAIGGRERAVERFYLTRSGPLMEAATVRRCEKIKTPKNRHFSTARGLVGGAITVSHGASNGFVSPHAERLSISGIISHDLTERNQGFFPIFSNSSLIFCSSSLGGLFFNADFNSSIAP